MDHERTYNAVSLASRQPPCRIIHSFEKAEFTLEPLSGHDLQVGSRLQGKDHQRQHGCVRRNDQVFFQPALQPEARHPESPVLVIQRRIHHIVGRLRNTPGHIPLRTVLDLSPDHRNIGLVE